MVKEREGGKLNQWLAVARKSGVVELSGFTANLQRDKQAVEAALKYEWSQGQVEGQINRLKMVKRQMFGRANFDLLRARVLQAT